MSDLIPSNSATLIDSIVKTCNFHIHNLYMIKDFVNRKNLVTLVHSLTIYQRWIIVIPYSLGSPMSS